METLCKNREGPREGKEGKKERDHTGKCVTKHLVIPALRCHSLEDGEFKASLGYQWVWGQPTTQTIKKGRRREGGKHVSLWGEFSKQLLPSVSSSALQCARASRASLTPPAPQHQQATYLGVTKLNISEGSFLFGQGMGQLPHGSGSHSTIPTFFVFWDRVLYGPSYDYVVKDEFDKSFPNLLLRSPKYQDHRQAQLHLV